MFTTVAHFTDALEAHVARGLLESEGIDAHLGDEHLTQANWEWRLAVGGIKLRVPDADADRAHAVLRAMEAGDYVLDDDGDADGGPHTVLETADRESWSSRLAWLSLMLFSLPLPWRRRAADGSRTRRM